MYWKLYLLVREILLIVSCPYFSSGTDIYLGVLVQEHHELYLQLMNKPLKPRHHNLSHYGICMKRNGPLVKVDTMTSERKHRLSKLYARAMNSRVNLPLSVAIKNQLLLSDHLLHVGDRVLDPEAGIDLVFLRKVLVRNLESFERFVNVIPFDADLSVSTVRSVTICGTKYCVGMVIVVNIAELYPTFAKIVHIMSDNGSHFGFVLNVKHSVMYHDHFGAFEVEDTGVFMYLSHQDFISYLPLWERLSVDGKKFISLRVSL
ncbi:uncharacterized protein LOC117650594 [Thrips palmi]|uniref:Uncharacterized protein LOC117650594 n=1 Tax=Thrips palmi TaxID=161013 RepID=A0A6P8ZZ70_THRPL|nr:uncharacterized protein LOC117650594 [Thrips palmi]